MGNCQEADPEYPVANAIHMVSTRPRTMPLEGGLLQFELMTRKRQQKSVFRKTCVRRSVPVFLDGKLKRKRSIFQSAAVSRLVLPERSRR